ncbi:MAG: leucine-rich repeat protein [Opitutaceae bacterium]|jgi:sugar lactone lactonase YvrE
MHLSSNPFSLNSSAKAVAGRTQPAKSLRASKLGLFGAIKRGRTTICGLVAGQFRASRLLPCLVFVFCLPSLHAATTSEGLVYAENGGTVTISGYTGGSGAVIVPATINGQPVASIGTAAFAGNASLLTVALPNSVVTLGDRAFANCTGLTAVTLGSGLTSIGTNAFYGCTGLANITLPPSLTTLGSYAFAGCTKLNNVQIPVSVTAIGSYAFDGCSSLASVAFQGTAPKSLGSDIFLGTAPNFDLQYVSNTSGLRNASIGVDATPTVFPKPTGVAVDAAGNLYVCDATNNTVQIVTPALQATPLVGVKTVDSATGQPPTAFNQPGGLTIDRFGDVFVADTGNGTIREITAAGLTVSTLAGTAGTQSYYDGTGASAFFDMPAGVARDNSGDLFIADTGNSVIRELNAAFTSSDFAGVTPILTVTPPTPQPGSTDGTGTAASFNQPSGIAIDTAGNLFIADTVNNTIRAITPAGVVTTVAGAPNVTGFEDGVGFSNNSDTALFNKPMGVAVDTAGNIYVADTSNDTIRELTSSSGVYNAVTLAGIPGTASFKDGVGDPAATANGTGDVALFNQPQGVAVDANGNVFVADTGNGKIRELTLSNGYWNVTTLAITPAPAAAPTITTQPVSTSVFAGSLATFSVAASGTPAPSYQWQVAAAGTSNWSVLAVNGNTGSPNDFDLDVGVVNASMNGYQYRCVVSNSAGSVTSNVATLTISNATAPIKSTNGGAPTWWFYGALSLLAFVRKFFRKQSVSGRV